MSRSPISAVCHACAVAVAVVGGSSVIAGEPAPSRLVEFSRAVVNLQDIVSTLQRDVPPSVTRTPSGGGQIFYGEIFRQLPGDAPTSREHNVPFAVRLEGDVMTRAWCDANHDGDLTNDSNPPLSVFPGTPPGRSFRSLLRWSARVGDRELPVERLVRVVVPPPDSDGTRTYRTQDVYGWLGTIEIEGVPIRALLYDANRDGIFTRGHSDGVFFDRDGDRSFSLDVMAPDFGPFAIPFSLAGTRYSVDSMAIDGSWIRLRELGPAAASPKPERGRAAPEFAYRDLDGKFISLSGLRGKIAVLYFWASWCSSCRRQAEELRVLDARTDRARWEIVGVNYDTERAAALRFRADHGMRWPTSFSGGLPAEDPVGRLYHESDVGVFYVIRPDGVLADKVYEVADLEKALDALGTRAEKLGVRP